MATSLNERKVREGLQLMKEAEKCLQTSWLKWKPDYDNAADKYTKAGTSFKVGKSYHQAKDAFLKAADAHLKNKSLYHSAKALEQAGGMLKETKQIVEAAELMARAGDLFQQNGTPDTAAMVVIKAARMCESTDQSKAVELYQKAAELREMDDKLREAAEPYSKATQLLIKQQKFEEVVNIMMKQLQLYDRIGNSGVQYKIILGLVVVHLHQGDFVAADKCFKNGFEVSGFGTSDEAEAIENLLDAYDQSDAETMTSILSKPLFRHLDNELSKLAKDLKPSEEFNISCKTTELRVISNDITRLNIDQTKQTSEGIRLHNTSTSQKAQFVDDSEENPLGSEERTDHLNNDETTNENKDDKNERTPSENGYSPSDTQVAPKSIEVGTSDDETMPGSADVGQSVGELTSTSDTVSGVDQNMVENEEDADDLEREGGLC